jgi:hypothetical protein
MIRTLVVVVALVSLTGCKTYQYAKAYPGNDLPAKELALLKPTSGIKIHSIDGDPAKQFETFGKYSGTDYEIALLPGRHVVVITYNIQTVFSRGSVTVPFVAEAGRRYLLKTNKSGRTWKPEISDVTGKDNCWSVMVGTTFYDPANC